MTTERFKLLPLKEVLALSKEKLDEKLAPARAKQIRAKAELAMAEIETDIVNKANEIQELVANKNFDFKKLLDFREDIAMLEIRYECAKEIISELFPKSK